MKLKSVGLHRIASQHIAGEPQTAEQVVRWMGAIQSQDYGQSLWAVGLRMQSDATMTDVERAIAERKIVRTWPMRGTIHLVPAQDVRWMLALTTPRIDRAVQSRFRQLGLDDEVLRRSSGVIDEAFQGKLQLTRKELFVALEQAGIATDDQRGIHIAGWAARQGQICLAALDSKQPTFALLDKWAPQQRQLDRSESLTLLARRYFQSHSPATLKDFVAWSGLLATDARAGLDAISSDFRSMEIDGQTYWYVDMATAPPGVHLLPAFDEFVIGQSYRRMVTPPAVYSRVFDGQNGIIAPAVVVDGHVIGSWKRTIKPKVVTIIINLATPINETTKHHIIQQTERYGKFVGLPIALTFAPDFAPDTPS